MSTTVEPCRPMILFNCYGIVDQQPIRYDGMNLIHSQYAYITSDLISFILPQTDWLKTSKKKARKMNMKTFVEIVYYFIEKHTINAMIFVSQTNEKHTYVMYSMLFAIAIRIDAMDEKWIWNRCEWQQERSRTLSILVLFSFRLFIFLFVIFCISSWNVLSFMS